MTPVDELYLTCAGAIGPDAWTATRLARLRAALDRPVGVVDGRPHAVGLLICAARCLLAEGVNDQTHGAVKAAVNVWRKPGGAAEDTGRRDLR